VGEVIDPDKLKAMCATNGYLAPQIIDDNNWCCLAPFLYTVAIMRGTERDMDTGYERRWCYHDFAAAVVALAEWKDRGFEGKPLNYITEK
jgi:hypothetical protein